MTLKTIKETPQHWNQRFWHCRSSHCFAGFAELLYLGISVDTDTDAIVENRYIYDKDCPFPKTKENATKILGITTDDAYILFHSDNTLDDLENYVNELCEHGSLTSY